MRRKYVHLALAAVVAGVMLGIAPVAVAQGYGEEVRVDLRLKDANMSDATRILGEKSGLKFVFEPGASEFPPITLNLSGVTVEEALRYICTAAGAHYKKDEAGVFIISNKPFAPPKVDNSDLVINPKLPLKNSKLRLRKADPRDVLDRLKGNTPDPNRMVNDLLRFRDLVQTTAWKGSTYPVQVIGGAAAGGYTPVPQQYFNGKTGAMEGGNGIMLPTEDGGQTPGGGGLGPGGGGPQGGGPGGQGQQGQGQLTPGEGLVPAGIEFITYDPTDNSLIVRGTEEAIAELQRNIALFDTAPKQVQIKVEFITTGEGVTRALGFDFLYQRGTVFFGNRPGSFARAQDPIFLNFATGNVTTRLRALLTTSDSRTVQAPIVRTLNNQPASVFQQIQTVVFVNQILSIGNGQVIIAPQPFPLQIQTGVSVAPRINDDGTITMFLSPTVQDFGTVRRGPNGEEYPDILGQQIAVVARVRNNETIALGGLTRKQDIGSQSKFPILGDLPIIGQFFRASNRDRSTQELIIFVTPTILEEDETGGGL